MTNTNNILKEIKLLNEKLDSYKIQLEHIYQNNYSDENYDEQVKDTKKKIEDTEWLINYYSDFKESDNNCIYTYNGPVYIYDHYRDNCKLETTAKSFGKAKTNILYRLKMLYNLPPYAQVTIDETLLKEVN